MGLMVDGGQGEKRVGLSPAQGRLARVLRERGAFLVRRPVTGWGFSSRVAEMAWGKALREDTVQALVAAGVLVEKRVGRVRVEFHLAESAPPQPTRLRQAQPDGGILPEVGQ